MFYTCLRARYSKCSILVGELDIVNVLYLSDIVNVLYLSVS